MVQMPKETMKACSAFSRKDNRLPPKRKVKQEWTKAGNKTEAIVTNKLPVKDATTAAFSASTTAQIIVAEVIARTSATRPTGHRGPLSNGAHIDTTTTFNSTRAVSCTSIKKHTAAMSLPRAAP